LLLVITKLTLPLFLNPLQFINCDCNEVECVVSFYTVDSSLIRATSLEIVAKLVSSHADIVSKWAVHISAVVRILLPFQGP
jgi:hypothetical protein